MRSNKLELVNFIQEMENEINQIKNSQPFGADALLTYKTYSNSQYDLTTTLSVAQTKKYRLTFNHNVADNGALLVLNLYYSVNNSDVMNNSLPRHPGYNPNATVDWWKETSEGSYSTWVITTTNTNGSVSVQPYMKFFIDGTDTGTWNIVQI